MFNSSLFVAEVEEDEEKCSCPVVLRESVDSVDLVDSISSVMSDFCLLSVVGEVEILEVIFL